MVATGLCAEPQQPAARRDGIDSNTKPRYSLSSSYSFPVGSPLGNREGHAMFPLEAWPFSIQTLVLVSMPGETPVGFQKPL